MTLRELYAQHALPVFQNRMYDSAAEARDCPKGDMRLVEDMETGLVYNAAFQPELLDYDANYQNEQGLSPAFRAHLDGAADLVEAHMGREALVEVGCGKGTFLDLLLARGVDVTGFDPTYEGNSPRVRKVYFNEDLGISGNGLILRHVLEHIPDPVGFLHRLAAANGHKGLIYIEVPCFDWICRNRAWFDIFYEHVNYFRLGDFARMFGRTLHLARSFGGQYLSVVADLSTLCVPRRDPDDAADLPADFIDRFRAETSGAQGGNVVWGGASKGVIYALMRERAGNPVARVIDINPAKQGRFLAATGLQVLSPEAGLAELPDNSVITVMNPNYLDEVRAMAGPRFICKGMSDD
ncbi:methyltransferase family protein [Rhodovulum bhavnagarense]|uniref:Methyltransferase family protein n=1 Tax=Rhodovulum bhavnagarense TaxID=992286 RepID=A0A4R2R9A0_9RHOB|nr:class I SAM-dependent methyltransferase [Rhodovulum bhavnagarense]TCP59802.1 methyltransferase family protein [Rhodovulum bhavnagarense]